MIRNFIVMCALALLISVLLLAGVSPPAQAGQIGSYQVTEPYDLGPSFYHNPSIELPKGICATWTSVSAYIYSSYYVTPTTSHTSEIFSVICYDAGINEDFSGNPHYSGNWSGTPSGTHSKITFDLDMKTPDGLGGYNQWGTARGEIFGNYTQYVLTDAEVTQDAGTITVDMTETPGLIRYKATNLTTGANSGWVTGDPFTWMDAGYTEDAEYRIDYTAGWEIPDHYASYYFPKQTDSGDLSNPVIKSLSGKNGATCTLSDTCNLTIVATDNADITVRYQINGGAWSAPTPIVSGQATDIPVTGLVFGFNQINVKIMDASGNTDTKEVTMFSL